MGIPQTSVSQYQTAGFAGSPAGECLPPRQYIDDRENVAQVFNGAITYAGAGTVVATINGVPVSVATDTDTATTRAALVAAINANAYVKDAVLAASGAAGAYTITAKTPGTSFTAAASQTGGQTHTLTETTANQSEEYLTPGRIVVVDALTAAQYIKRCKLPRASTDCDSAAEIAGVVLHSVVGHDPAETDPTKFYAPKTVVPVGWRGVYWVEVEEAVTPASTPYVRYAAGTYTGLGAIRASADSSSAQSLSGIARFLTAAGAGELAKLAINLM